MKLKDIKFNGDMFDAQWLVDLHNMETGDDKSLEEFIHIYEPPLVVYTSEGVPLAEAYRISSTNYLSCIGQLDNGWLFKFVEWLDMGLYLDLMKLVVDSLGWDKINKAND